MSEDLKMKAGAEYQRKVSELEARYKAERAALDAEYEAQRKVAEAFAGLDKAEIVKTLTALGIAPPATRIRVTGDTTTGFVSTPSQARGQANKGATALIRAWLANGAPDEFTAHDAAKAAAIDNGTASSLLRTMSARGEIVWLRHQSVPGLARQMSVYRRGDNGSASHA